MEKEMLGTNDIPGNMKAGCGRAGFYVSPAFCCNLQADIIQCSHSSASKHRFSSITSSESRSAWSRWLAPLALSLHLVVISWQVGWEAGVYISRERFNLDFREVSATASLVRHETVTFPKTCPQPCEGHVGQSSWTVNLPYGKSGHGSLLTGSQAQLIQFFTAEEVIDKNWTSVFNFYLPHSWKKQHWWN